MRLMLLGLLVAVLVYVASGGHAIFLPLLFVLPLGGLFGHRRRYGRRWGGPRSPPSRRRSCSSPACRRSRLRPRAHMRRPWSPTPGPSWRAAASGAASVDARSAAATA